MSTEVMRVERKGEMVLLWGKWLKSRCRNRKLSVPKDSLVKNAPNLTFKTFFELCYFMYMRWAHKSAYSNLRPNMVDSRCEGPTTIVPDEYIQRLRRDWHVKHANLPPIIFIELDIVHVKVTLSKNFKTIYLFVINDKIIKNRQYLWRI